MTSNGLVLRTKTEPKLKTNLELGVEIELWKELGQKDLNPGLGLAS